MAEYLIQDSTLAGIANAIREKNGSADFYTPAQMASAIAELNGGGSEEEWIGDGNTHIWIHLEEGRTSPMLGVCPKGTVTVDWGDGTTPDVLTGTSTSTVKWTPTHNYAAAGDYVVTLIVSGTMGFCGEIAAGSYLLRYSEAQDNRNYAYLNSAKKIEVGGGVQELGNHAFNRLTNLMSIYIPSGVRSTSLCVFYYCYSLPSVQFPDGVTNIAGSAFYNCYSLSSVQIPDSVTGIGGNAFTGCQSLSSLRIPEGVSVINAAMLSNCFSLGKIRFEATNPPTVTYSGEFKNVPTDCVISVPVGTLAAYTSATNYPDPATYTYIEEA